MAEVFANKIKRLELENFTCFGKVAMDFSPGINVIIGENGTGKTHLLKVLSWLHAGSFIFPSIKEDEVQTDLYFEGLITDVFKVSDVSQLIKSDANSPIIRINIDNFRNDLSFGLTELYFHPTKGFLFIPTLEMLSWFKGFISSYENRESYIDEVYYRLAKAIAPLSLKGEALERQKPLLKELEEAIRAKVIRRGDDFFLSFIDENKEYPVQTVATGINKLAQLIYLIMNGSLTKDTILFWDEPEANLNPKYILVVSKFLQTLAKAGCQIFVATHDYLLPYDLSLSKEYQDVEGGAPDMKFFSLFKGENGTEVEEGATMPDLNHDPIHEGLSQHNNREDALFRKSLNPQA